MLYIKTLKVNRIIETISLRSLKRKKGVREKVVEIALKEYFLKVRNKNACVNGSFLLIININIILFLMY